MSLASNNPTNTRLVKDVNYVVSASMPSVSPVYVMSASLQTTGNTTALDFIQATPYPTTERVIVRLECSALTGTSGSQVVALKLQDSADNSSFADIATLSTTLVRSGDTASVAPATNAQVLLPPGVKRYVRAFCTVPASGSANGGVVGSYTASVLF